MITLLFVLLLGALQMVETGTPRPTTPGTSAIAGRVTDAVSKQPLSQVTIRIRLETPFHRYTVTTDAEGRYELDALPPGNYLFSVDRPSHYLVTPDGTPVAPSSAPSLALRAGQRLDGIDFTMKPGGTIRGVITDDAGRPLVEANVTARSAQSEWRRMSRANKTGEYEIGGLPPGNFFVEATVSLRGDGGGVSFVRPEYARTFYPSVTNEHEAAALNVSGGEVIRNVNIIVPLRPPKGVSGRLITATGSLPDAIEVVLESSPAGSKNILTGVRVKDGGFAFAGAKPGRYMLWARGAIGGDMLAAAMLVTVVDAPTEVDVLLAPTGAVEGRVVTESSQPLPSDAIRVVAMLADGDTSVQMASPDQADVTEDGAFMITGLFGDRIFRLNGLPPEWAIKKVVHDRREVAPPHVSIRPGVTTTNIQIVIGLP